MKTFKLSRELGGLVIWVILLLKAYQGQMHLPVIRAMAQKQAGAV